MTMGEETTTFMRPLRVVIADGGGTTRAVLLGLANDSGFELVGEAPTWDAVVELVSSRAADLVLVSGGPDFAQGLSVLAGEVATAIVAPDAQSAKEFADCGAFVVLTPAVEPEVMAAIGTSAVARAGDLRAARQEAENLRGMLETRKVVERAKGVLIDRYGMAEGDAFRFLQQAAMDRRLSMREVADAILAGSVIPEG